MPVSPTKQTDDQIVARLVKIITSHNDDYDAQPDHEHTSKAATERDLSAYDAIVDVLVATGRVRRPNEKVGGDRG